MKYPHYSRELLKMLEEDQRQIRNQAHIEQSLPTEAERQAHAKKVTRDCHRRAARMLKILDAIGAPTFDNIGPEAAEAVSVFALHSYLDEMKHVLAVYEKQFAIDPASFYKQAIPPLTDRIMIAERRRQKFGTNWSISTEGRWFLIPVDDFANVNALRAQYGLEPIRKPRCLAIGMEEYPLGKGPAGASDQKALTDEEYAEYTADLIRR